MRIRPPTKRMCRSLALALVILAGAAAVPAQDRTAPDIVAVVNAANHGSTISVHELRLLYALYKRTWSGGVRVHLVLPPSGSAAMDFLVSRVFRQSEERQIDAFYLQAVFAQSIVTRPPQLSGRATLDFVRSTPGAIGLVDRAELPEGPGTVFLQIVED